MCVKGSTRTLGTTGEVTDGGEEFTRVECTSDACAVLVDVLTRSRVAGDGVEVLLCGEGTS